MIIRFYYFIFAEDKTVIVEVTANDIRLIWTNYQLNLLQIKAPL